MSDKKFAPGQAGVPSNDDGAPARNDEDYRQLCRRYSRYRARTSG
ncbi:MAG TPA: hypothetical protein VFW19_03075 [Allosphingosinicella sp.]|nr:hypothetical protein [Allosphingosinicella sp.]